MSEAPDAGKREIDPHVLGEMAGVIGDDGVAGLIDTFLHDLRRQLPEFESALLRSELPQAQRSVHSLKSASCYLGAQAFAQLCITLENCALTGDIQAMNARRTEFRERAQRIEQELIAARAGYSQPG